MTGEELAKAGCRYMGIPYSKLDCQAFVEKALSDIGLKKDLAGSNTWYRFLMTNGWVGTPEECKKIHGFIPVGAFLFIHKTDGKEPAQYRQDGIGNLSHIGIYTGMTGAKMCEIARQNGVVDPSRYNFGNGALHSSSSKGCVCTSTFSGNSIKGGWNRIGLWNRIDYSDTYSKVEVTKVEPYQAKVVGGRLSLREQPSSNAERLCWIPDGEIVNVTDEALDWAKTAYNGYTGWVMKQYLEPMTKNGDTVVVSKKWLTETYDIIGGYLGLRG